MEKTQRRYSFIFESGFLLKRHLADAKVKVFQQIRHIMMVNLTSLGQCWNNNRPHRPTLSHGLTL
jgi:hypothetical protein